MLTSARLLVLALALCIAGCRQADGPTPAPTREQSNEIGDIARDMINVANKDPQAGDDLRTDLLKYATNDQAGQRISELAAEVSKALAGARLENAAAESLAKTIWVGLTARELSQRQVAALTDDVRSALAATGVPEDRARSIGDRLSAVQQTITDNPRRWYQVF